MNARVIIRIELDIESKVRLDEFCNRTGMTKIAAASRLVDWFSKQPDAVQAIVQSLFPPPIESEAANIILKHLAAQGNSKQKCPMKYAKASAREHFRRTTHFRNPIAPKSDIANRASHVA
jgi:hypothetical protein